MTKSGALWMVSLALFFAPALFAGEIQDDERKYQYDMSEGKRLLKSGSRDDIARAIAKFKNALKARQESAEAYYWIGLAYSDQGTYPRAANYAKDATIYDERMSDAWLLWGQALMYQKEWKDALEKLETAFRLAPDDPLVLYDLGRAYYHGFGDPDGALPKFRSVWQKSQAIRLSNPELIPVVQQARLYMGYCEFDRRMWDNAINAFRDVLSEMRDCHDAVIRLALAYRNSGRAAEAERTLLDMVKTLSSDPAGNPRELAEAHLQLAHLYLTDPGLRNRMFGLTHLRRFVDFKPEGHPLMASAQGYLAENEFKAGQ